MVVHWLQLYFIGILLLIVCLFLYPIPFLSLTNCTRRPSWGLLPKLFDSSKPRKTEITDAVQLVLIAEWSYITLINNDELLKILINL